MKRTADYCDKLDRNGVDDGNKLLMQGDICAAINKYDQLIEKRPYYAIPYYNKRIALSMRNNIPSNSVEHEAINTNQLINKLTDLKFASHANTCFVINTIAYVPEYEFNEDSSDEEADEEFDLSYNRMRENKCFPFITNLKKNTKLKAESQILDKKLPLLDKCTNSRVVDKFLSRVFNHGFEVGERHKLSTIAVSIGLNRMESLSTRKNNSLILELESKVNTQGIKYKRFGYFWKCAWYTKDGMEANINDVRKFYKKLKRRSPNLAKEFLEKEEGAEYNVPYQDIREYAKNHPKTKELIKEFRDNNSNALVYLHLADEDVCDFNGIFSAYLRIIHGCYKPPTIMSTGYEFPKDTQHMAFRLLGHMERMYRVITTFYIPLGTYYPEPNMCILISENSETVEESFIDCKRGRTLESPILLNNIQNRRHAVYAIFSEDNPMIIEIPSRFNVCKRTKQSIKFSPEFNKGPAAPTSDDIKKYNRVSQSHSDNLTWIKSLFINNSIKYDNNYETDGECVNDKNNKPLKGVDKQCIKLIGNLCQDNDVELSLRKLANRIGDNNASNIVDAIKIRKQYDRYFNKNYERTPEEQELINIMIKHEVSFDHISRRSLLMIINSPDIDFIKDPELPKASFIKITVLFSEQYEEEYNNLTEIHEVSLDTIISWDFEKISFLGSDDIINAINKFNDDQNIFDQITECYDNDDNLAYDLVKEILDSVEDLSNVDFAFLMEEYETLVKEIQDLDEEEYFKISMDGENKIDIIVGKMNYDPDAYRLGFALWKRAGLIDSGFSTPRTSSYEDIMALDEDSPNVLSSNDDDDADGDSDSDDSSDSDYDSSQA